MKSKPRASVNGFFVVQNKKTAKKEKRVLERSIEARFLRRLKELWPEAKTRKMNGYGNRSWPDRLVVLPFGAKPLIEFKRPGGELSSGQANLIKELKGMGHSVYVCDDAEQAILFCEFEVSNAKRKKIQAA